MPTSAYQHHGVSTKWKLLLALAALALLGVLLVATSVLKSQLLVPGCTVCALAIGLAAPRVALSLVFLAPFVGWQLRDSLPYYLTTVVTLGIIAGVLLPRRRKANPDRRAIVMVLAFTIFNLWSLFTHKHGHQSFFSLFAVILTACGVALAVTRLRPSHVELARIFGPTGIYISWLASQSADIVLDRTSAVAGQNANGVGMIASVGVGLGLVGLLHDQPWWRLFHLLAISFGAAGVYVSQSRGSYLNIVVFLIFLVSGPKVIKLRAFQPFAVLGLIGLITIAGPAVVTWSGQFTGRYLDEHASQGLESRWQAAGYSIRIGVESLFQGVGQVNTLQYAAQHGDPISVRSHVVLPGIFGEVGILAFLVLLFLVIQGLSRSLQSNASTLAIFALTTATGISVNWWPLDGIAAVGLSFSVWCCLRAGTGAHGQSAPSACNNPTPGIAATSLSVAKPQVLVSRTTS